jgi:NAD(P)-dependent dehydrogenase (short-subunit alcohol dehydrogenase family)
MVFDRFSLHGKVAIVTGAGRGLGRTMALALAQAGASVVAVARTAGDIRETVDAVGQLGRTGLAMPLDVTDSKAVDGLVAHVIATLGSLDILVNHAGGEFGLAKAATDLEDEEWSRILNANLTGAFYCSRAAGRSMLSRGWGRVINIACIQAVRGSVNHAAYAAAKGGLMQLTQALALEWAKQGVTVNTLGVGWFEEQPQLQADQDVAASLKRAIPVLRLGLPTDVETALVYLASDASHYFTGQSIWLDGGILCR